jgi:hypothetical protein
MGRNFIPSQYLPEGCDEHYLRNLQQSRPAGSWRHLRAEEIEALVKNNNTCHDWDSFLVTDPFNPQLVKNCEFWGLVRLGKLESVVLEHHELQTPAGLYSSFIISCDLGDNVAVRNVRYLSHYLIGDNVMLLNVDEMNTTSRARFGNGIVKDGETETARLGIELMNEIGGRGVLPFDGMIPADAYVWAKYRDDEPLLARLREITQSQFDSRRGFYGTVGDRSVIKHSRTLKDVKIGPDCYIKGANKLKNLTIHSSEDEPTQIGEGVELVNGIVGPGCHVFYGCKAVRFVMGSNATLKYGARLIHSFLGDNSTVSCCEILNNLVFPAHEQHHNNSFLIASLLMGQSNLAAGATVGSNHNSRANDGEIQAGRGFWPGLCVTLKHSCRFASYTLLAKGDYPSELDIPLPFSLLMDDPAGRRLQVMPAYWWMYNMYALARNEWKFHTRDKRKVRAQKIEFDALAPDTAEEIFRALELLELWTAKAHRRKSGAGVSPAEEPEGFLREHGRALLLGPEAEVAGLEILGERMENSSRKVVLLKVHRAYHAYRQMLHYYAARSLLGYLRSCPQATFASMCEALSGGPRVRSWINLGGQLVPERDVDQLRADIASGRLGSWHDIHARYDALWEAYPTEKRRHALATLAAVLGVERIDQAAWQQALDEAVRIQEYVRDQVYLSRKKDYDDPYRQTTYRNAAEMTAVLGAPEENSFVQQVARETEAFRELVAAVRER